MKKILLLSVILFLFISCRQKDKIETKDDSVIEFISSDGTITVVNSVMRPAAKGMNSAIFLEIKNNSKEADTLFSAESNVAELVEIHETFRVNKDKMGMRHVENVVIQHDSIVKLKPGSYHIMLITLYEDATIGNEVRAKLLFKNAGEIEFTAQVKDLLNISKR